MNNKFIIPANHNSYILFGGYVSRATAVQMVLEELEIKYDYRQVITRDGEHKLPEYLKINPAGYVPTLVTPEGHKMHEAAGICLWLVDVNKNEDLAPLPQDKDRVEFLSKLFFITNDIQPSSKQAFFSERYAPTKETISLIKDQAIDRVLERWSVLNDYLLNNGPFILGERFSFVDIYLSMWAAYGLKYNDDILGRFPAIEECFKRVLKRPKSGYLLQALRDDVLSYKPPRAAENASMRL
jgi:glutathione S-transferase